MSTVNPCKEFGGDSNLYMNVEGRNFNTEVWFANLLSNLIRRGIDSDEHHHFKDSPLGVGKKLCKTPWGDDRVEP